MDSLTRARCPSVLKKTGCHIERPGGQRHRTTDAGSWSMMHDLGPSGAVRRREGCVTIEPGQTRPWVTMGVDRTFERMDPELIFMDYELVQY